MTIKPSYIDFKVLPFTGAAGEVAGHEIRQYLPSFLDSPIRCVVFELWHDAAQMMLETLVPWQQWTMFMRRTWPNGGTITAVILQNGHRIHAEGRYAWHSEGTYNAAPIIARDCISVVVSGGSWSGIPLLEIVGVMDYLRKGTPLSCPWERDNRKYREELIARGCNPDNIGRGFEGTPA